MRFSDLPMRENDKPLMKKNSSANPMLQRMNAIDSNDKFKEQKITDSKRTLTSSM